MILFADLLERLAFTLGRNAKLALLRHYFAQAPDPDRGMALAAIAGDLKFPAIKTSLIRELAARRTDPVLFDLSHDFVGDLAETVALIWPEKPTNHPTPRLSAVVETLATTPKADLPEIVAAWLDASDASVRLALLKLITGGLRVGASGRLAKAALAELGSGISADDIDEVWHSLTPPYTPLFAWIEGRAPRPDPADAPVFRAPMLACELEEGDLANLVAAECRAERTWDGIRVQLVSTPGGKALYSCDAEDISAAFPEILAGVDFHAVLDGELLVMRDGVVAPFGDLQQRLNRKSVSAKMQREFPVHLRLFDMLFEGGEDIRPLPFDARRARLEEWFARVQPARMDLSEQIAFASFDELANLRRSTRAALMLKRADAPYVPGRVRGLWWTWKPDTLTIDAVLMYAQRGPGGHAEYTFGLWRGDELLPVGKASSGFTDDELRVIDKFVRENTVNRFGPVREVARGLVLEVAFDAVHRSTRHKAGVTLRSPRIVRLRNDKPVSAADRLDSLMKLIG